MTTRLLFIVNPVSGKKTITDYMIDILNLYCKEGLEVSVLITQYQGHAAEYVKTNSQRFDRIVCAGGDGTINEVVSGLREACDYRTLLGYIPCGSTNDFASNFGLGGDVMESARRAISDNVINLDSGVLNDHSFLYTAAFGMFTDVTYSTPQSFKNVLGHQAYVVNALNHLASIKPIKAVVAYDDQIIEDEFLVGLITNSERVAGFSNLYNGEADLTDGLFEVLLIRYPKSVLEINEALTGFVMKNWDSKMLYYFKTKRLKIWSDEKIKWTLDGEYGGEYSVTAINNRHGSVRFCI
ncbi:MAG: YegS/Rv2252/BmrU family lipid kinase [Lachnospiraceae bacterium]|nr:YegS/Rv2252/BmrU family lipid kinase [Lachnospiraceae bacterium]MDY4971263.1 YegS/Rv2252/BmrU family lipid kinase [Lachnospiraceae bacterium]